MYISGGASALAQHIRQRALTFVQATERFSFGCTERPAFPAPLRFVGRLTPEEAKHAQTLGVSKWGVLAGGWEVL